MSRGSASPLTPGTGYPCRRLLECQARPAGRARECSQPDRLRAPYGRRLAERRGCGRSRAWQRFSASPVRSMPETRLLGDERSGIPVEQNRRWAAIAAIVVTAVLLLLIYIGSRGLRDFDAALIGYAVASVFAATAL